MNQTDLALRRAFSGLFALSLALGVTQAIGAKDDMEKCAGIVKAGKNDCGTSKSACAGTAKVDNDPEAWVHVPKGVCQRIAGGMVITAKWAKPGGGRS